MKQADASVGAFGNDISSVYILFTCMPTANAAAAAAAVGLVAALAFASVTTTTVWNL